MKNSENGHILISQNFCDGHLYALFGSHKKYGPAPTAWGGLYSDYSDFSSYIDKNWNSSPSKNIYSIAADETHGFGGFFMKGFGTGQTLVVKSSYETLQKDIREEWDKGKMITSCSARGSTFYVVMTKDVEGFNGKDQVWFMKDWSDANKKIDEEYEKGKIITSICYNHGLKKFFVAMTESKRGQAIRWFSDFDERKKWMAEKYKDGYRPTITFNDSNDDKLLVVMTKDENISDYILHPRFEIE